MRRLTAILSILLCSLGIWAGRHTYADHSALREGRIVKIRVSETGVHCLPYDTLRAWGLQPEKVRVLGYGGAMLSENFTEAHWDDVPSVPVYMHKGADGVFGSGDYVLFYAQGPVSWKYKDGRWQHTQNTYSNYGYYFVSDTAGEQRFIETAEALDGTNAEDAEWFSDYRVYEKDVVNLVDISGTSGGGREFYDEPLHESQPTQSINFTTQNVLKDRDLLCYMDVAAAASQQSNFVLSIGSASATATTRAISGSDFYTKAECAHTLLTTKAQTSGNQPVNIRFSSSASGAKGYLNYVELTAPCALTMSGNEMPITNTENYGKEVNTRFLLSGTSASTQIWRVTDGVNITQMPTTNTNGKLAWVGNNAQAEKYIAVNVDATGWKHPVFIGTIANQDLHALRNIDYVIITP